MSDLISRQAAIEEIKAAQPEITWEQVKEYCRKRCLNVITAELYHEMTHRWPAQPRKGKWIDNNGLYQCSACKHIWSELWWSASCPMDRMNKLMRYCPNCGADMRGE